MDFNTVGGIEAFSFVGQGCEGLAAAHVFVVGEEALFELGRLGVHFHVEHGGLVAFDAAKLPAG